MPFILLMVCSPSTLARSFWFPSPYDREDLRVCILMSLNNANNVIILLVEYFPKVIILLILSESAFLHRSINFFLYMILCPMFFSLCNEDENMNLCTYIS